MSASPSHMGRAGEPDQLFPIKLEIVDDGTPLTFVGPDGAQSGVGLTWETDTSPYDEGPKLVGAKLNRIGDAAEGEGGVGLLEGQFLPNDEFALYGGGAFKIRILTTGGFSPDGLTGVTPDQFEDFFQLHATGPDGETVLLTETRGQRQLHRHHPRWRRGGSAKTDPRRDPRRRRRLPRLLQPGRPWSRALPGRALLRSRPTRSRTNHQRTRRPDAGVLALRKLAKAALADSYSAEQDEQLVADFRAQFGALTG